MQVVEGSVLSGSFPPRGGPSPLFSQYASCDWWRVLFLVFHFLGVAHLVWAACLPGLWSRPLVFFLSLSLGAFFLSCLAWFYQWLFTESGFKFCEVGGLAIIHKRTNLATGQIGK
jgi:hypothetical protein